MISKVEIRNFRTHKKRDIEFGRFVTTITGGSYKGKSTIIRALRWVLMNKPSGDKVIHWDADKASVRLTVDDKKIVRKRGKSINSYKLEKKVFVAFGNDVPPPISKLFNMSDINFQGQHDAPFWFCETAGEVSRQLNSIVNLEVIDKTLANIASFVRTANANIKLVEGRVVDAKEIIEEYSFATDIDEDLSFLEIMNESLQENVLELSELSDLIESGESYRRNRKRANTLAVEGKTTLDKGDNWLEIASRTKNLGNLVKDLRKTKQVLRNAPPKLTFVSAIKQVYEEMIDYCNTLNQIINFGVDMEKSLCQRKIELTTLQSKLKQLSKGKCPLCGNQMTMS